MSIVINNLTYTHPDGEELFRNINISIAKGEKVSLVGDNGTGKSTLLKLLMGQRKQDKGDIFVSEMPYYVPQHSGEYDNITLADALGVKEKLDALHAILNGNVTEENLAALADDWEIEERIWYAFQFWEIEHQSLSAEMRSLSGGEKTKIFLTSVLIHHPDIILLDEPSNHLDYVSRQILYDFISNSRSTILIVSHDRELLNLVDMTIEISRRSVELYGGNYDFYKNMKEIEAQATQTELDNKLQTLKRTQQNAKTMMEQRQKQEIRGKVQKQKSGIPRIAMGRLKNKAEQSSAKFRQEQAEKVIQASNELDEIKEQLRSQRSLNLSIGYSGLHQGKVLVKADSINYSFSGKDGEELWQSPLSFQVSSGERVEIKGNNGSGKTTLLQLILRKLSATTGALYTADFNYILLDQEYSIIDAKKTVFEQISQYNERNLTEQEIKDYLFHHRFPYSSWDKSCNSLSGGEKMKLVLCCMIVSNHQPDLLILDEPTNNLDIHSQEILLQTVRNFQGTILVISHDKHFLESINIDRIIEVFSHS